MTGPRAASASERHHWVAGVAPAVGCRTVGLSDGVDSDGDVLGPTGCGAVRILDLEFVTKRGDGSVAAVAVDELDSADGLDLTIFDGAKTAIKVGVASSVHGRVQRRQQRRGPPRTPRRQRRPTT